jgi:CRP-like cAMP-binding protein
MEHMPQFLDVLRTNHHKWAKLGSLGDMVDATLGEGGYKEVFKKERLVGKLLFGKQRKTLSDTMKRIGIKNVKHRDLLVEVIYELSKPQPPQSEEEMMTAKFTLVRNTWSNERKPDIQLHAMADVLAFSGDESKHELLKRFDLLKLLKEIISGNMMDAERERILKERQLEIDELWKRRRKRELDYEQKKDLDRKEHLQARDWLQWKADFGSLAVAAFATLQNVSKSPVFTKEIARDDFPNMLVLHLDRCRDAEKHLTLLRAMGKGQYMSLVASEVAEQQLMILNIIYNLSLEPENRKIMCSRGVAAAVVQVSISSSVRDTPRYLQCMRIFCNLSLGAGETEVRMVQDKVLGPVVNSVREGFGESLLYAISTVANLAFVEKNRDDIVDAGVMIPLCKILKEQGETPAKLKALDAVRNLAAAYADLRFAKLVVDELIEIVRNGAEEERLRALIALRSVTRFEETLQICEEQGVIRQALALVEHEDIRVRTQALGLLINVIGMSAVTPMDADEEDELSDSELFSDDEDGDSLLELTSGDRESGPDGPKAQELGDGLSVPQRAEDDADAPVGGPQATGAPSESGRAPALDVAIAEGGANWESLEEVPTGDELVGADRPLQRANKLLQARVSPFFRLLTERELELLALGSEYFIVRKGDALVVQGDSSESIYMVVRGIMRVLIGAKGAGKWGMHRIARNKPKASSLTTHLDSSGSPESPKEKTCKTSPSSPHSPKEKVESPTFDSPVAGRTGHKKGGETKTGATFRAGKDTREVSRLRPGDSANELCVMEGRRSLATLVGMTEQSVIMDIKAKQLADVLLARPEFKDAISSGEMVMMSDIEKVRRVWKHPAMSDEAAEKSNLFRIESRCFCTVACKPSLSLSQAHI